MHTVRACGGLFVGACTRVFVHVDVEMHVCFRPRYSTRQAVPSRTFRRPTAPPAMGNQQSAMADACAVVTIPCVAGLARRHGWVWAIENSYCSQQRIKLMAGLLK